MPTVNKNYFYLSEDLYGKNMTVRVNNQGFAYNHDDIIDANRNRFSKGGSAFTSWSKYRCYTKTSGYPKWASNFVKNI